MLSSNAKFQQADVARCVALLCNTGYDELKPEDLSNMIALGSNSSELAKVCHWFSVQFQKVLKEESTNIDIIDASNIGNDLAVSLKKLLKQLDCPKFYLESKDLDSNYWKLVLEFLSTELQASKMICNNSKFNDNSSATPKEEIANDMKSMLISIGLSKPPPQITAVKLFTKVESMIKNALTEASPSILGNPLCTIKLSEKEWSIVEKINETFNYDYSRRRQMLLKRLDVTVQSFSWSDEHKKHEDKIAKAFCAQRQQLHNKSQTGIPDLLAARDDLLNFTKTSDENSRKNTKCAMNRVLIGKVPDRGGRPSETSAPPPEMPGWKPRTEGGGSNRGGFRGGFRGNTRGNQRGGRVQGSWSKNNGRHG